MIFYDGKNKADITIIDNNNDIDVIADLLEVGTMETEFKGDNVTIMINGKIL